MSSDEYGPYDPATCCPNGDCWLRDENCAGEVEVWDEEYVKKYDDWFWIHYCEYHWPDK